MSHTTADVTVSAVRAVSEQGVDWDIVTGAELAAGCHSRGVRDSLRRALRVWFGTTEAERRWPELYRRPGARVPGAAARRL